MENYLETLAIPSHMEKYDDGMCAWIKPKEGNWGPACVYKMNFSDKTYGEIYKLIDFYLKKGAPNAWITTPLSLPEYVRDILILKGLSEPLKPNTCEKGMALLTDDVKCWVNKKLDFPFSVKRIKTIEDFMVWTDIANAVLHGGPLISAESYYPLCADGKIACYLGYNDKTPVSTSATINNAGCASLEFVATLPGYRKQGIATAVCCTAIQQLINDGAHIISLRASPMGIPLYTALGFESYFSL